MLGVDRGKGALCLPVCPSRCRPGRWGAGWPMRCCRRIRSRDRRGDRGGGRGAEGRIVLLLLLPALLLTLRISPLHLYPRPYTCGRVVHLCWCHCCRIIWRTCPRPRCSPRPAAVVVVEVEVGAAAPTTSVAAATTAAARAKTFITTTVVVIVAAAAAVADCGSLSSPLLTCMRCCCT
ncbi:hypothetical protein B484DRAFT_446822 [Ochromonadaceae sp. CCMP2298]|nr:hypothetical protein B484DRAFT_446822 [Ochromonadaceae sp. CCMP2298]